MKSLLTLLLMMTTMLCYGQEPRTQQKAKQRTPQTKVQPRSEAPDKLDARHRMLNNEIEHLNQRLDRLRSAAVPRGEKERAIRNAHIQELELEKMWKKKELAVVEADEDNEYIAGLRGEAKALRERYNAAKDIRIEAEHSAAAMQAEKGDETAVPNPKIKMQREKLRVALDQYQTDLIRELQSEDPDVERIAKLKGEIESTRRKIDDLDERR